MSRSLLAAALIALVCVSAPAVAQDTTVSAQPLVAWVKPYIEAFAAAVVAAVLAAGAKWLHTLTGIKVEEKWQKDLHSAAMTGVSAALNFVDGKAADLKVDVRNEIIAKGIRWIISSVPDALKGLGIDPSTATGHAKLVELASSKLGILSEAPASIPVGTPPAAGA